MAYIRGTSGDDVTISLYLSGASDTVYGSGGNDTFVWDYSDHAQSTYFDGGGGSGVTSIDTFLANAQQDVTMDNPTIELFSSTKQGNTLSGDVFVIRFENQVVFNQFLNDQGYENADAFYADLSALEGSLGGRRAVDLSDILGSNVQLNRVEHIAVVMDNVSINNPSLVVNTGEDIVDPNDGLLSLREAILQVNENPSQAWTITFESNVTSVNLSLQDGANTEDSTANDALIGDLDIVNANVSILGDGVTINASGLLSDPENNGVMDRALHIVNSDVYLEGLTFTGGYIDDKGGAVYINDATVDIVNSLFVDNSAAAVIDVGSGILRTGSGGALAVDGDSVVSVEGSGFQDNYAENVGGAIAVSADAQLTIQNSEVSNNTAGPFGKGGGFYAAGTLVLDNVTTVGNTTGYMFPANDPFSENSYQSIQNSEVKDYYGSDGEDIFSLDNTDVFADDTMHLTLHNFDPTEDMLNLYPDLNLTDGFTLRQVQEGEVALDFDGDGDTEITLLGDGLDVNDIVVVGPSGYTGTEDIVSMYDPTIITL